MPQLGIIAIPLGPGGFPKFQINVVPSGVEPGHVFGLLEPSEREVQGRTYSRQVTHEPVLVDGEEVFELGWKVDSPGEIWTVAYLVRYSDYTSDEPMEGVDLPMVTTLYGSLKATLDIRLINGLPSK